MLDLLSFMGSVMDLNHWLVLAMFLGFVILLFQGIPVAYALVGIALIFALFAELVLGPNKKVIQTSHYYL